MITVFRPNGEARTLPTHDDSAAAEALAGAVWVDLLEPTEEDEALIERVLSLDVPTRDELKDIEPSSRLYTDGKAAYMTASLMVKAESDLPHLTDIAFILTDGRLLTVRYAEPRSFSLFKAGMHRIPGGCSSPTVMITRLLETIADRTAEILEITVARADRLSLEVFGENRHLSRRPPRYLEDRVVQVSALHRLLAKTRDSLTSLSRLLTFLHGLPALQADRESLELCRAVTRDVQSLSDHATYLANKITFLLDALLAPGGVAAALCDALDAAGPYGAGWPSPRVAAGPARLIKTGIVGDGHVRGFAAGDDGKSFKWIAFRSAGTDLGQALLSSPTDARWWLAGTITRDEWNGGNYAEMHLEDAAPA